MYSQAWSQRQLWCWGTWGDRGQKWLGHGHYEWENPSSARWQTRQGQYQWGTIWDPSHTSSNAPGPVGSTSWWYHGRRLWDWEACYDKEEKSDEGEFEQCRLWLVLIDMMLIVPYLEETWTTCRLRVSISWDLRRTCRLTTLHTNSSQTPQSNSLSKSVSLANKSGSNDPQADSSRSVPASHASGASAKSHTTSLNGVAVARSGSTISKSKKPTKKSQVVEISDPEDDDSLERNAALASPAKGAESRKATKVCKSFIYVHYMY